MTRYSVVEDLNQLYISCNSEETYICESWTLAVLRIVITRIIYIVQQHSSYIDCIDNEHSRCYCKQTWIHLTLSRAETDIFILIGMLTLFNAWVQFARSNCTNALKIVKGYYWKVRTRYRVFVIVYVKPTPSIQGDS